MGSSITIKCSSLTVPKWLKDNKAYFNGSIQLLSFEFQIEMAVFEDTGVYTCIGTLDDLGTVFTADSKVLVGG